MEKHHIQQTVDAMLNRIYLYFKDEYVFMKMCNSDKCNLKPLHNCKERTALATGKRTQDITNAVNRVRAHQSKHALNEYLKDQLKRNQTKEIKEKAKTDSKLHQELIPKKGKTSKKRKQEDCSIITDTETENLKISIEYPNSPIPDSHASNSFMIKINDQVNADNATYSNQREFPSTSQSVENRILPSTKQYSAQCEGQLDLQILPFVHPIQRRTIQFEDENSENNDQENDDTETYIFEEVEFEDEQEFEADSYMEQLEYKIDVSDTSVSEQFIQFSENLPSTSKTDNDFCKIVEAENVEFVCIKNEVHSDSSD
ncbi:uncharacterized protein [Maniola hyperantus]|uniref:uncharacterized protein n=1 Tax=Aphantopus hyperantus TaxID=2795564 RepID=UPI002123A061